MAGGAPKLAILGANGQIGSGLIHELSREFSIHAVVRDTKAFRNPLVDEVLHYDQFLDHSFALIVNAAGPGDPQLQRSLGHEMFRITEQLDNAVLQYLDSNPGTHYVFISTGDVHRFLKRDPATGRPAFVVPTCDIPESDCYALSKLFAETKHRTLPNLKIWDVRVFGYFSRHIALDRTFFLSHLRTSLAQGIPFRTHGTDFVRDYISFDDLAGLVRALVEKRPANGTIDLVSALPLTKSELLEACAARYGLKVELENGAKEIVRVTKPGTMSVDTSAATIGYLPRRTSMETVLREMDELLSPK